MTTTAHTILTTLAIWAALFIATALSYEAPATAAAQPAECGWCVADPSNAYMIGKAGYGGHIETWAPDAVTYR